MLQTGKADIRNFTGLCFCSFCFACCCGCFGGDRRQATCCKSSKPQELPEGTDLGLGPSSSTAASPELLHERSAAVTSSPNETPAEAALAPPPAVVRCFGREISQKWCNRGMLIAMVVIAIIYFSLVMVAFGSINNVGDGTNSMVRDSIFPTLHPVSHSHSFCR